MAEDSKPDHEHTGLCSVCCFPSLSPELSLGAAPGCSPLSFLGGDRDPAPVQFSNPPSIVQGWTAQTRARQAETDGQMDRQTDSRGSLRPSRVQKHPRRPILLHPIRGDHQSQWPILATNQGSPRSGQGPARVFAGCSWTERRQGVVTCSFPPPPAHISREGLCKPVRDAGSEMSQVRSLEPKNIKCSCRKGFNTNSGSHCQETEPRRERHSPQLSHTPLEPRRAGAHRIAITQLPWSLP